MIGTLVGVCGIVAVIGRRDDRDAIQPSAVTALLSDATALLSDAATLATATTSADGVTAVTDSTVGIVTGATVGTVTLANGTDLAGRVESAAALLREADDTLRSLPGVRLLVTDAKFGLDLEEALATLEQHLSEVNSAADAGETGTGEASAKPLPPSGRHVADGGPGLGGDAGVGLERLNVALGEVADHIFALRRDRLRTAREIVSLWGGTPPQAAVQGLWSIQVALSALDRLEVRGRDSAGLQVFVRGVDVDPKTDGVIGRRLSDPVFGAGAVRRTSNGLAFVYKTAAEIGELGDNTAALRSQIRQDELLRWALTAAVPTVESAADGTGRSGAEPGSRDRRGAKSSRPGEARRQLPGDMGLARARRSPEDHLTLVVEELLDVA